LVIGLSLPLISYQIQEVVKIPSTVEYEETNLVPLVINSSTPLILNTPIEQTFDWNVILQGIYVLGILFMLIKLSIVLYKLLKISRISLGNDFISTKSQYANSSFFNLIFIDDSNLSEREINQILEHEKWHIRLLHSYDLLFVELLKIAFWFNPILWLYQRSLSEIHEYEVDSRMIQVYNPQAYAQLLLKLATATAQLAATHQFSRKPLTDRIHFLFTKQKSVPMKRLAYLSVLPILGAFFMAFSVEKVIDYQVVDKPDEKYFKVYEKADSQVNNEVLVKENKVVSNLIYGKNRVALTMNPAKISLDAIVAASPYFKKIGFNLDVITFSYHNSSKQLDKFEVSLTEDIENNKKFRSKMSDGKSDLPFKFTFDLKKMKGEKLDDIIIILADRSTGEHFVAPLSPPPPPPAPPKVKPSLSPKVPPKPPVPPKLGFLNNAFSDSVKLIGEGQLGKNPLVFINGKSYPSNILYKLNPTKISNSAIYKRESVLKKFGVENSDGAIEINTFNRLNENLFLSKTQLNIAVENEMKRREAHSSGKSLTRVTLKDFSGNEKDEIVVYKDGSKRASATVSKGGQVLFQVGDVIKTEDEMKEINSQLLGSTVFASEEKKEIEKLGMKINSKPIEAIMKFIK
jgi:hypothetical protein